MKLRIACILIAVFCFVGTNVFAGGSGNVVSPIRTTTDELGVGVAFEYNYVQRREKLLSNEEGPENMKVAELQQPYGKITVGLFDNFNVYAKIGSADYELSFSDRAQGADMDIDLEPGLYTGAGINALFPFYQWEFITFGIGGDMQANFFLNEVSQIRRNGIASSTPGAGSFYGVDGQNSAYVTAKVDVEQLYTNFVPYVGFYHSWIAVGTVDSLSWNAVGGGGQDVESEDYQAAFDFRSFGLTLGCDFDIAKYANINLEGRFGGETALTTGVTLKY